MEDLKELIATAVEEGIKRGLTDADFALNGKDPNELLTAKQISEETGIAVNKVRELFKNPDLSVQTYAKPRLVARAEWNRFIRVRR